MSELASLAVHAHVIWVETATLGLFVAGGNVRLQLDFVVAVGEGASLTEATRIVNPIFT